MKKVLTIMLLMLWCIGFAVANPVGPELARRVALNFLRSTEKVAVDLHEEALVDITATTPFHEFYIFSIRDRGGFILVSGNDCALPILGYSTDNVFVGKNIPNHVQWWLNNYEKQLTELREGDFTPCPEVASQWGLLTEGESNLNNDGAAAGPLITTTWNQSPYYNNLCPSGTPTGCVATATAQVMKYWNWPVRGMGSHSYTHPSYGTLSADFNTTYDWANMPNWLSSSSSTTQVEAVAKLIFHVGVALEMYYGTGGSSAYTVSYGGSVSPSAEEILPTYFLYDSSTIVGVSEANYTSIGWINLLKNEIDNQRPMLFRGAGSYGGHSFVCDGYNASDQFHFNWGWGGLYDGYFTIGSLNPGGYSFNSGCWAVIGIQPLNGHIITATANPTAGGTVTGGGSYANGSTCTLTATPAFGYEFTNWTCGNTVLSTNATYSFTVTEDKTFIANFTFSGNNCNISLADLPYTDNFDSYTTSTTAKTGVEPTCWTLAHQDVAMTDAYKPMIYYSSAQAHSGNYSLILNKRGIYAMPRYEGNVNTLQLQFYVKQTALKNQLQVGVMSDPTDASTFVPVDTIDNSTYTASIKHTVRFNNYTGTGQYIAFRNTLAPGNSGDFSCNYIDDLILSPLPDYIVSATPNPIEGGVVTGTGTYAYGSSCTLVAVPAPGYSFSHWKLNDTIEISGGTYTNVYYPTNAESPYSYTQQIYYASQLGGARDITGISYHLRSYGCTSRNIDIYMAETSQSAFPSVNDYIPLSDLQLVYSGTFSGEGDSWVDINFDEVFTYTGEGNLVIAFDDNTGYTGTAGFATFYGDGVGNCAMHFHKTTDIDPASPNGSTQRATGVQNDIRFISDMGMELPNSPIYTFTVTGNKNLTAVFTLDQHNYTVLATANPAEGGTVTGAGTYMSGSSCTLVATSAPGYTFSSWTIDDTLEIAEGLQVNYYYPTYTGSLYSYTQEIYSSSQLNGPIDITGVAYHIQGLCSTRNINLYLAETDIDSFYSVSDHIPLSQLHLVYSGTFGGPEESWTTIILDSVFHYSGMHNLVVAFDDNTGTTGSGCFYRSGMGGLRAIHYQNTIDIDPASPYGTRQLNTGVQSHIRFVSDTVVSTSPTYTFTVTCNKRLKANFTPVSTCDISPSDLPYFDNFDTYTTTTTAKTGVEPPCWTLAHQYVAMTDEYKPMIYYNASNAHSGSYSLLINKRGIYAMPAYKGDVSTLQLSFYLRQNLAKYQLQVGVMSNLSDPSTFVPVATINNSTTNIEFVQIDFASYTGHGRYIAFRNLLASGYTGDFSCNYIDDLTLDFIPTNTCSISPSDLPYTDNFDTYTASTTAKTGVEPPCWTLAHQYVAMTEEYKPMIYYNASNAHSGSYSLLINKRGIYAMPAYEGDVSTLQMQLYVKQTALKNQLQVGVMTNLNDASTFVPVATINNTSTTASVLNIVDFANYSGNGHYIAFRNTLASGYTGDFSCNYIDDLILELRPTNTCSLLPSDLPYTDNFDSYTTSTTAKTGVEPDCWTLAHQDVAMTDEYKPMVYYSPTHAQSGQYSLILNKRGIYALPKYEGDVNRLWLWFSVKQTALKNQLEVGVMTDLNDPSTFLSMATIDNTTYTAYQTYIVSFVGYTDSGHYIALRNTLAPGYTGDFSLNFIDDLTLMVSGSASDLPDGYSSAKSGGYVLVQPEHRDITLYPNPTTGKVTVEADDEVLRVDVYDYTGRRVATFENQATVDLGRLATGIYTLRMTLPERIEVRRVVKQ